jgi:tetratricopeptide (TPR) repeat protein
VITVNEIRSEDAANAFECPLKPSDPAAEFLDPQAPDVGWIVNQVPDLEQTAAALGEQAGTSVEKARRAWQYVQDGYSATGLCYLRSSLFCHLCRRQGLPARLISGLVSRTWAGHYWAEYYLPGYGWIPVDWIPGSGFDGVSNKHIAFVRGQAAPRPAHAVQSGPIPCVVGQWVDAPGWSVTYAVREVPLRATPPLSQRGAPRPPTTAERCALGRRYKQAGQTDQAITVLEAALETDPACAEAHWLLGWIHAGRRDREAARQSFEAFLKVEPTGPRADEARGALGRLEQP